MISAKVAALTEGVMKAMFLTKIKIAMALLLAVGLIGIGTTLLACRTLEAGQETTKKGTPKKPGAEGEKKVPVHPHDFKNLQRLATALENFNYTEKAATSITIWRQGGGKGTSVTIGNAKTLDLTKALSYSGGGWENCDLENVAIVSADDRTIRFVNVKEKVASREPFGLILNRGDLVVVLQKN
jgi:hypothetical protein